MYQFLGLGVIIALAVVFWTIAVKKYCDPCAVIGSIAGVVAIVLLLIAVVGHTTFSFDMARLDAMKYTLNHRTAGFESAALELKVLEMNKQIAGFHWWNTTMWGCLVPDKWNDIPLITIGPDGRVR